MLFPALMPMPFAPKSPRPKMRSPSVMTATRTSLLGHDASRLGTFPASLRDTVMPGGLCVSVPYCKQASPTVGVYRIGNKSAVLCSSRA